MSLWGDERGAAVQVGVAILLAFIVLAITTYQVEVVPNQNAEIEFDHNQDVQNQLQELRGDIVGVSDGNSGGSQAVQLGTSYPARTIFVNPPAPSGSLETVEPGDGTIELEGAVAAGSAAPGTEHYWDGTPRLADTSAIEYRPRYNEFRSAPEATVYEHSALYNENPNDAVTNVADQLLVEDDEITLVALQGDLDENSRQSVSVRTRALSRTANTVTIEPEDGEDIELTIPTEQPDFWDEELPDDVETEIDGDEIEITLDESYDLRMAQVGVGDVTREDPDDRAEYIVEIDDQAPTVVAEVRDQFNNPVRNTEVNFSRDGGSTETTRTNSDGQVQIPAQDANEIDVWINASDFGEAESFERQSIEVSAVGGGGGGGAAYDVFWLDEVADDSPYDVSQDNVVPLTMGTDPVADGASVEYSVNDSALIDDGDNWKSGETGSDGENTTPLPVNVSEVEDRGGESDLIVFVSSGSDGDREQITLQDGDAPQTLSFVDDSTFAEVNPGNEAEEVTFEFEVEGPDDLAYEVNFTVINQDDEVSTLGPLVEPTSPQTVTENDGDALPNDRMNQEGELDLTIRLFDEDGNLVEDCVGTIDTGGGSTDLDCD